MTENGERSGRGARLRATTGRARAWRRRLRFAATRPLATQWLLTQTLILLGLARLAVKTMPYARLEQRMGERHAESPLELADGRREDVREVKRAIRQVSAHTPWTSNCFPQALVAQWLLRRRRVPITIYLGAAFSKETAALTAHAWSRCGPIYVTGGASAASYEAVMSYA